MSGDDPRHAGVIAGVGARAANVEREGSGKERPGDCFKDDSRLDVGKLGPTGWQQHMCRKECNKKNGCRNRKTDQPYRNRRGIEAWYKCVHPRPGPRGENRQVANGHQNQTGENDHGDLQSKEHNN